MLRVVADTNIYISAYNFGKQASKVLELAQNDRIQMFVSPPILSEVEDVMIRTFNASTVYASGVKSSIVAFTTLVHPTEVPDATPDKGDNDVLACGLAAQADYIVSGDKKHLLVLKEFRGIEIVSVRTLLDQFEGTVQKAA